MLGRREAPRIADQHWNTGYITEPFFQKHFKEIWQQRVAKLAALVLFLGFCVVGGQVIAAVWAS